MSQSGRFMRAKWTMQLTESGWSLIKLNVRQDLKTQQSGKADNQDVDGQQDKNLAVQGSKIALYNILALTFNHRDRPLLVK